MPSYNRYDSYHRDARRPSPHSHSRRRDRSRERVGSSASSSSSSESLSLSQQSSSQSSRSATPNNYKQRTGSKRRDERGRSHTDKDRGTNGKSSRSSTRRHSPKYAVSVEKQRFIEEQPLQNTGHQIKGEPIQDRKSGDSGFSFYDDASRTAPLDPPPPPPPLQAALPSPPPADPPPIPPQQAHADTNRFHTTAGVVQPPSRHSPARSSSHDIISPRTPHGDISESPGMMYRTSHLSHSHSGLVPSTSSFDAVAQLPNYYTTAPLHFPSSHPQSGSNPSASTPTQQGSSSQHRMLPTVGGHQQITPPIVHHSSSGSGHHQNPSPQKRSSFDGGKGGEHHPGKRHVRWPWGHEPKPESHPTTVKLEKDPLLPLDDPRLRHPRHSVPIALYKSTWLAAHFEQSLAMSAHVGRDRSGSSSSTERRKESGEMSGNKDYHHSRLSLKVSGNSADGTGGISGVGPLSSASAVDESDEQMSPTDTASLLPPPPSAIDSLVETTVMPVVDNRSLKQRLYTFGSKFQATESSQISRSVELEQHETIEREKEEEPKGETFAEKLERMKKKNRSSDSSLSFEFPSFLKASKPPFSASSVSPTEQPSSSLGLSSIGFSRNPTSSAPATSASSAVVRPALSITIPQQTTSNSTSTASTPTSGRNTESPMTRLANAAPSAAVQSLPRVPPPSAPALSVSTPVSRSATTPVTAPAGSFSSSFGMPSTSSNEPAGHHSPVISAPPQPPLLNPTGRDRRDSVSSTLRSPPMTPSSSSAFPLRHVSTSSGTIPGQPTSASTSPAMLPSRQMSSHNVTSSSSANSTPKSHIGVPRTSSGIAAMKPGPEKIASRHDSFSSIRSPSNQFQPPPVLSSRSMSTPDATAKKPTTSATNKEPSPLSASAQPQTSSSNWFNQIYQQGKGPQHSDISKLPRIQKKPQALNSAAPTSSQPSEQSKHDEKHRKEGKDKEHKPRKKEYGTYETKEERAARKAREKEKKAKKEHKKEKSHKKDRKKDREDRDKTKERKAGKEKRDKEKEKEKEAKKKQKKKKKFSSDEGEESETDEDTSYRKSISKQLAEAMEDGGLVGGLSMYDRVKRRSSAANRDDGAKKAALSAIREKTNEKKGTQKKGRVVTMETSSDEEEEQEEETNDAQEGESEEDSDEEQILTTSKKKVSKRVKEPVTSEEESDDERTKKRKEKKKKKESKLSNMKDVFGEGTSEDEAKEKKKRKKKEMKKEATSEDSDEPTAKKARKNQELDLEAIFGKDRPSKKQKKEDKKEKESKKRTASESEKAEFAAKRVKKEDSLDERSDSSDDGKKKDGESRERKSSDATRSSTSSAAEAIERALFTRKDSNEASTSADQNQPPAPICNQNATSAVCSVEIKEESRPKLMTKAAMKVFEPPANQQSSSHLHPEGGHAAAAAGAGTSDSSSDSIDSDDDDGSSFGGSQRTPSLSLSTASGQALRRKLAEKSLDESITTAQPPAHQPLSQQITLSSSSVCSESDNDSQLRSPRRPVELVDATAGYEPIRKEEEQAAEQPECKKELPEEEVQEQTEQQTEQIPTKVQTPRRTAAEEDEDAKAANEIAEQDVFIFDDVEEEQEPRYPSHDFMHKQGAVVKEEAQEAEQQLAQEQHKVASPMNTSLPGAVCHAPSTASSSSASDRLLSPTARSSSEHQTPLSAEIGSPKFPQSVQKASTPSLQPADQQLHLPIQQQQPARQLPVSTPTPTSTIRSPTFASVPAQDARLQQTPQPQSQPQQQVRLPTVPSPMPPTASLTPSTVSQLLPQTSASASSVIHQSQYTSTLSSRQAPSTQQQVPISAYSSQPAITTASGQSGQSAMPSTIQQQIHNLQQQQQHQQSMLPQAASAPSVALPTASSMGSLTHGIPPTTTTTAPQHYNLQQQIGGLQPKQSSTPQAQVQAASPVPRPPAVSAAAQQAQAQAAQVAQVQAQHQRDVAMLLHMQQLYGGQLNIQQLMQQTCLTPTTLLQYVQQIEAQQRQTQASPQPQNQAQAMQQQQQQVQAAYQRQQQEQERARLMQQAAVGQQTQKETQANAAMHYINMQQRQQQEQHRVRLI
ncbi:hypothetical protein WR25_24600 isoform C [Diploscapter pachys]|uniref:SPOC domain-containing protein n=1 Tax=Diploscapter pachys TaxID=2018661 RepID=A0A2A2JC36_9BILA|nr:hypothetical protein WR25_24600 isoform B [Diploscapter pachys]PAV59175.1 hypothetical protein WR25_24600 isoform C [Diploscapter pachys]